MRVRERGKGRERCVGGNPVEGGGVTQREKKRRKGENRDKFSKVMVRREGVSQSFRTGLPELLLGRY